MPVLSTKLHLPQPRTDLVARPRLTDQLASPGTGATRLVLLSAPAGFGKTTLLSQWLASRAAAVAWVSLDPGDNDVRRFLLHVVAALATTTPGIGHEAAAALEASGELAVDAVLTSLLNDLDTLAGETFLALDDYHEISEPAVHEALDFLLEHAPPQLLLAMTTRSDPPFPLARLRSRGGLVELRAAELRFTPAEAQHLLNDRMGLNLTPDDVGALDQRTEGWVAGLQLAALSLRGRQDAAAFVEAFAGSHRFVLDYLVEEVLDRQTDAVRTFLLETSVLRELHPDLCEALTGTSDARGVLRTLERDNVFLVPLDDERQWYRYHHLFADALRARAQAQDRVHVAALHVSASEWLAEHGMLAEATWHAVASGDHERAADLFELELPGLRRARQDGTLLERLAGVPEEVVRRRPLLATCAAWSRLTVGDLDGVEEWLDAAESGRTTGLRVVHVPNTGALGDAAVARDEDVCAVPSMIEVYRAAVAQARGDVPATLAHASRARDLVVPGDHSARAAASGFLGLAAWASGDLDLALETFAETVAAMRSARMVADELGATVVLASMWLSKGRPVEARRLYEAALEAAERSGQIHATVGDLHVGLADVLREGGSLVQAAEHLDVARGLGDLASLPENRHRWFTAKAGLLRARGDLDGAVAMLDRAEELFLPGYFPDVRPIAAERARVEIAHGRLKQAQAWASRRRITAADPLSHLTQHEHLTLARLLVADGAAGEAMTLLDRLVGATRDGGRDGGLVEALVVRSLARKASGASTGAEQDLAEALAVGVPAGYCRLFLDEGPALLGLVEELAQGAEPDVRVLARELLQHARPPVAPPASPVPDLLSEREVDVVRLLATDLTGPEIAQRLFVSVNTLRTHTKHIFTKLDVNTRRAAVGRAAELGLV